MERKLPTAHETQGVAVQRDHPFNPTEQDAFVSSQRIGTDVFQVTDPDPPLLVARRVAQAHSGGRLPKVVINRTANFRSMREAPRLLAPADASSS